MNVSTVARRLIVSAVFGALIGYLVAVFTD